MTKKAVFFDKDGTLVVNVPYNVDPNKIILSEGAEEALKTLKNDFQFHIVTNQAGVAQGYFTEEALIHVKDKLSQLFKASGATLKDFHYCPHSPETNCMCRKPGPGLIVDAARNYEIDLNHSWMIGDILDDVEAGNRAGCKTILIDNGNETEWKTGDYRNPHFMVRNLAEAARIISSS
jgi:D-glycero-D-manno-heptose 1,7-bisphosphate phosphatase